MFELLQNVGISIMNVAFGLFIYKVKVRKVARMYDLTNDSVRLSAMCRMNHNTTKSCVNYIPSWVTTQMIRKVPFFRNNAKQDKTTDRDD